MPRFFSLRCGAMSTILESREALRSRALECGLTAAEANYLITNGASSLARLAFAAAPPGTAPSSEQTMALLPANSGAGAVSSLKRLIFEAQTLVVADIKNKVQRRDEAPSISFMSAAERENRIDAQRGRLTGLRLRGDEEVAHGAYDLVLNLMEKDQLTYLAPERFGTRKAELAQTKPGPQLQLDQGTLSIKPKQSETSCSTRTELELVQAFRRRALAFDLVGLCSYDVMNHYHSELVSHLQESPLPGYQPISIQQVLRADRAAFTYLGERLTSLKVAADGTMPLQSRLATILVQPSVTFNLLPLPGGSSRAASAPHEASNHTPRHRKPKRSRRPVSPSSPPSAPPHNVAPSGAKGKGAGKSKRGRGPNVPQSLIGKAMETPGGERLCWAFNLPSGCQAAKPGEKCNRGWHLCAEPGCAKAHSVVQHS